MAKAKQDETQASEFNFEKFPERVTFDAPVETSPGQFTAYAHLPNGQVLGRVTGTPDEAMALVKKDAYGRMVRLYGDPDTEKPAQTGEAE